MCSWWEPNKSPWLESALQTSRITEMLNSSSQDRLMLPWVIQSTYRIRTSITWYSLAMRNSHFLTLAMRIDSALRSQNWQIEELLKSLPICLLGRLCFSTTNVATELRACVACTALSVFDNSPARLLENPAFRVQMFAEFWRPPKGPKFFCCSPNHFPQRLTNVLKEPLNREDKWRQMKTWPPEAHPRPR